MSVRPHEISTKSDTGTSPCDEHAEGKTYELCAMPTIAGLQQMLRAAGYDETPNAYTHRRLDIGRS